MMANPYTKPDGLAATASAYNTIGLTWSNNETAYPIEIQRKPSGGTYATIATVAAATDSYSDTGCSGSVQYTYRIRYNDGISYSDFSDTATAWTPPQPPSDLAVSYSGKTATLTWTNNGTAYTYVKVYWKASSAESWTTDTETLSGTAVTRDITVTAENTSYGFRIRGYYSDSTLNSEYETESDQTSGIMAPTDLLYTTVGGTQVDLTWTDNSSVEDGFEIYKDGLYLASNVADDTSGSATGLTPATAYKFKVRAYKGTTYSAFCTEVEVTTGDPPDADPVIGTVTAVSSTSLTVTWTDTATNATKFYIYRSTDDLTYTEITSVDDGTETYTDTGLTDDTTYYYKVKAWNVSGWSSFSDSANGTTSLDLDPPTDLVATAISATQITITWTDNAPSADYHCVEIKSTGGTYDTPGTAVTSGTNTLTIGSLSAGTLYTFRIRARHDTPSTYGDYSVPVEKKITIAGTEETRRNETYIALGHVLGIVSETPQTAITSTFRTRPMDFADQDPAAANRFKTVRNVQIEYVDRYASVPMTVYVSVDDGKHWNSLARYVGEGDGTSKCVDFNIEPLTGKYITVKIVVTTTTTSFTITGMFVDYTVGAEYYENDVK